MFGFGRKIREKGETRIATANKGKAVMQIQLLLSPLIRVNEIRNSQNNGKDSLMERTLFFITYNCLLQRRTLHSGFRALLIKYFIRSILG